MSETNTYVPAEAIAIENQPDQPNESGADIFYDWYTPMFELVTANADVVRRWPWMGGAAAPLLASMQNHPVPTAETVFMDMAVISEYLAMPEEPEEDEPEQEEETGEEKDGKPDDEKLKREDLISKTAETDTPKKEAPIAKRVVSQAQQLTGTNTSVHENIRNQTFLPQELSTPESEITYQFGDTAVPLENTAIASDIKIAQPAIVSKVEIPRESHSLEKSNEENLPSRNPPEPLPNTSTLSSETPAFEIPEVAANIYIAKDDSLEDQIALRLGEEEVADLLADPEFTQPIELIEGEFEFIDHEQVTAPEDSMMAEEGLPILLFEQDGTDEIFTEPEKNGIIQTLASLAEAIEEDREPESLDKAQETLDEILDIILSFDEAVISEVKIEGETIEELEELFIELFEILEIEYIEEMPKKFARLAVQGKLTQHLQKLIDQNFDELAQEVGTYEGTPPIVPGSDSSQNFVAQVYALGEAALQLSDLALAA